MIDIGGDCHSGSGGGGGGGPSDDAKGEMVVQLCAMGFDTEAVKAALEASGWSLEAAANRLMG